MWACINDLRRASSGRRPSRASRSRGDDLARGASVVHSDRRSGPSFAVTVSARTSIGSPGRESTPPPPHNFHVRACSPRSTSARRGAPYERRTSTPGSSSHPSASETCARARVNPSIHPSIHTAPTAPRVRRRARRARAIVRVPLVSNARFERHGIVRRVRERESSHRVLDARRARRGRIVLARAFRDALGRALDRARSVDVGRARRDALVGGHRAGARARECGAGGGSPAGASVARARLAGLAHRR